MINNEILGEVKKTNYFCAECSRVEQTNVTGKILRKFKKILR